MMKFPLGTALALGLGIAFGCLVAALSGVRDSVFDSLSCYDPKFVLIEHRLSASYKKLGNAFMPIDADAARDAFQRAVSIDQPLADAAPSDPISQAHLAYSCGRLGELAMSVGDYSEAESQFALGVNLLEELSRVTNLADLPFPWPVTADGPALTAEEKAAGPALLQYWLEVQRKKLEICREAERAIGDLHFALAQPKEHVAELLTIRGRALAKLGRTDQAAAAAGRLAALEGAKAEQLFDAARIYTLAAANTDFDESRDRDRYLAKAVGLLTQAANAHFFGDPQNRTLLKVHRDFVPLYGRDDFQQLLTSIPSL
jgi:tetratricopeptide (TPR) repeat protein